MSHRTQKAPLEAVELLGDFHPFVEQLGSVEGLVTLAGASQSLQLGQIDSLAALRSFLRDYHARILCPLELPAIHRAFHHAGRGELRELVALDQRVATEPILRSFVGASRRVGQAQLQKLRPLRDQRLVQRYLAAVDEGRAHGWHTIVYGITLAVYSLPMRQGLFGYAHQTTRGFIHSAARTLKFSEADARAVFEDLCAALPAAIEALLCSGVTA
jgi:urease accessory protein UreF